MPSTYDVAQYDIDVYAGGTGPGPGPGPSPEPTPTPLPTFEGVEIFVWEDPSGVPHVLNDPSNPEIDVQMGVNGLYMPRFSVQRDQIPNVSGSRKRSVRTEERTIDLPFLVRGPNAASVRTRIRDIAGWFNPDQGDGKIREGVLRIATPSQDTRRIKAVFLQGLEGPGTDQTFSWIWQKFLVTLLATQPYFEDDGDIVEVFGGGASVNFFPLGGTPSFLHLSPSSFLSGRAIANTGQLITYPTWILKGPATGVTLTNNSTGQSWTLNVTLLATETVTVDTENFLVTKSDGSNLFGSLTPGSNLWPLRVGGNDVTLTVTGSTTASQLTLRYRRRYLTA